jgi:hypothetical protein
MLNIIHSLTKLHWFIAGALFLLNFPMVNCYPAILAILIESYNLMLIAFSNLDNGYMFSKDDLNSLLSKEMR